MGYGPIKNGKQLPITPRNGKNWCDLVNRTPMTTQPKPKPVRTKASGSWL